MRQIRQLLLIFPLAGLLTAVGCRGPALSGSFTDYSAAYASSMNSQILLNLARRANGHPAYFMQMGQINTVFSFEGQFGTQVGKNPAISGLSLGELGANAGLAVRQQPAFSFTPLSGGDFATGILRPIDPEVFYSLYSQGHPVNQLMRMMVENIQLYYPEYKQTYVLVNRPEADDPGDFIRFLRFAGLARQLQVHHKLYTVKTNNILTFAFEPDAGLLMDEYSGTKEFGETFSYRYKYEDTLGEVPIEEILKERRASADTAPSSGPIVTFQLRTFYEVLSSLATEQRAFEQLAAKHPEFLKRIPPSERRPILRFHWPDNSAKLSSAVAKVNYEGKSYQIADEIHSRDPKGLPAEDNWNREAFILLTHLYHQISIDPSKLPAQQLIQVQ